MKKTYILFDLDGTLIDNFRAIYKCYADIAREMGLVPKSYHVLRATVGEVFADELGKRHRDGTADRRS